MTNYLYQVGGSLAVEAHCYVIRKADSELYKALKNGEFCYVLNSRQMGKSSLLVRTRHKLQQESVLCATVDMTRIGSETITPAQWYKGIIADLWRGFNLSLKVNFKSWWKEQENLSLVQQLGNFIEEILLEQFSHSQLVIFIDEIDSILSLDFPIDDFFALIRFCYNQRAINPAYKNLTWAIFGVATPSDLITDRNRTPFNIGKAIEINGFTLEEAQPLAKGLTGKFRNSGSILKEILTWTNGQPFLTHKLCNLVLNLSKDSVSDSLEILPGTEGFWVETLVKFCIIQNWQSQDEPEHLKTIRDRILRNEQRAGRLLAIYQQILQSIQVPADDSREQEELLLSGLIERKYGLFQVKNLIYQRVFNQDWVEKELKKLRPYSQTFDAWIASQKTDTSRLLRGQALKDAQLWAQGKSLSDLDYHFLAASLEIDHQETQRKIEAERTKAIETQLIEEQKRLQQEQKIARLQRLFLMLVSSAFFLASALGLIAFWQYRQARISEIRALTSSSEGLFASHRQLDAMIEAIKAKRRLQDLGDVDPETAKNVEIALRQTVYGNNEFNRLIGHQGSVLSVDISPNDRLIATASNDKTVKLWRRDGTLLHTLKHTATVHRVAFNPDSRLIVSGSLDGKIRLWSIDGRLIQTIQGHQVSIWGVAFSPNGKFIASSSSDKTIKLWTIDGKLWKTLTGHQKSVWNIAFSPNSQIVASAGVDNTIKLWTIDGKLLKTLKGHQNSVWDVAFCQQSNLLVSVSSDRTAKLWKLDGSLVRTLESNYSTIGVDCQGEIIATGDKNNTVTIWKTDGTLKRKLQGHQAVIRDLALSSDGLLAASASDDGTVKLWERNQYLLRPLYGHQDTIWDIATSPNGKLIASVSGDDSLKLWGTDGILWQTLKPKEYTFQGVVFSPNNQMIVTGNNNGNIQLWHLSQGKNLPLKLLKTFRGHQASVYAVALSSNRKIIASAGDDRTIKLWNFDGKLLHSFIAHSERIWKLAFNFDGQFLASASADGKVKIWQTNGNLVATLSHEGAVWGIAWSPQKNIIASTSRDDILKLWTGNGKLLKTIPGQSQGLTRVAFSPDGQTIATAGVDNTVKLWDLQGKLLRTLPGHQGMVISLAFTPDGKFLVSGGDDSTVIIWDLKKIENLNELEYACNWVGDYLRTNVEVEKSDKPDGTLRDRHLCDNIKN
ncbi:AAA-like domain-containing protein [Phormidium sp. LEGE 05292]|uniref:WD40 domain-containing protein n=1 Tax=[Phormidium] sp. LEGE 05292 TaxID=767427 RepID=UPI0018800BF2|nr:AAA-like domain-containing protein [Phormidium sp. LEGE 05292]MBE9225821.1 AAA-like domain-containing protein [Phormidium sp. LEGE 05292]